MQNKNSITKEEMMEKLQKNEAANFKGILSSLIDLVFVFDKDGQFIFYHAPNIDDLYVPPEKFVGKTYSKVMPPYITKLIKKGLDKNKIGETFEFEYPIEIKGKTRWFYAKMSPLIINGKFEGSVAIARDITEKKKALEELKESEEKYRNLFDNMLNPVFIVCTENFAKDLKILNVNLAGRKLLGYTKEGFNKRTINDLVVDGEIKKALKNASEILKNNKELVTQRRIKTKDNKILTVELSCSLTNYEGKRCFLIVARDLTPIKKAEEKIEKLEKQKIRLTNIEKKVLYGLVAFPSFNDRELSNKLKIKISTVTAARRRLRSEEYFQPFFIPNFSALGCELLSLVMGYFKNQPEEIKEYPIPFRFSSCISDGNFFEMYASRNLSEFQHFFNKKLDLLSEKGIIEREDIKILHFSNKLGKISKFLDYSDLLKSLFKIDIKDGNREYHFPVINNYKFSKNAKKILLSLINNPEATETELSQITGLSRPTVSNLKKRLLKDKVVKKINIPNYAKLAQEIIVFYNLRFNNNLSVKELEKYSKIIQDDFYPFISMNQNSSEVGLGLSHDYPEYTSKCKKIIHPLISKKIIDPSSKVIPLLTKEIKSFSIDFYPLVKFIFKQE